MTVTAPTRPNRMAGRKALMTLPLVAVLAACEAPLDYDLRGQIGAFNTTKAAQTATASRPKPDDKGLITYPSYQVAVARRGDTLGDVASRIGLPASELARFNGMKTEDPLRQGEIIALPRRAPGSATAGNGGVDIASLAGDAIDSAPSTSPSASSQVSTASLAPQTSANKPQVQSGPEPVRHKVKRGETAYTVSRLYQVPVKSLADWNGLGSDFAIREGQFLLIPLKDRPVPRQEASAAPVATAVTAPGEGTSTPTPPSATKPLPSETVAPAAVVPKDLPKVEVPAPTRSSTAAMSYPVQGKIIRTYAKGKNDGIDIAAAANAPVKAADGGTVAAITKDSNNIPIIVIRHDAKLLTVYANVDKIEVNKGDTVKRGQTIATLRDESSAYVHFEVRNGFESVDPLPYLQ
ncbi:LysM peptidoglycan-binding domain-containing M23 family metallopeptidase [Phaeobacter porticola]|uniref:Putative peptidoglycan binding peptidase n=1 Tax=Phaeobacter porticola TaxID=1844006 RepID=A0A1L3I2W7_9RHOB|nr:LysM peptidoglycan-binding domain-containing M23 family metallopeptidase [Phaeobacter porticola]APG46474.1 putative peptidoglycan binding peptidase [Phaeobacter porticola]